MHKFIGNRKIEKRVGEEKIYIEIALHYYCYFFRCYKKLCVHKSQNVCKLKYSINVCNISSEFYIINF